MFDWNAYLAGLAVLSASGVVFWLLSIAKRDVSIVDSLWSILFVLAAITYYLILPDTGPRGLPLLILVGLWALRLSVYITWRNWGEAEDRRYQAIRANNEPHFELKSLYIVFLLQALTAWVISVPLLAAMTSAKAINIVDYIGVALWVLGILFEAGGDLQLARFKADPANRGRVLDRGLWRYTRHPNYFGNACIWWGLGLIAAATGAWWALLSPLLMTFLLLKVSGVSLLERDIGERRPAYAGYAARTSAFFPWPPKSGTAVGDTVKHD